MIIIVEGQDRLGKSTLIQNLQTYFAPESYLVLKFSVIKNISPESHKQMYLDLYNKTFQLFQINQNLLIDRFILGEHVYSPIYRGYSTEELSRLENSYLEQFPQIASKICLITLTDNPENLLQREDGLSLSGSDLIKIKKEKQLFEHYHNRCQLKNKLKINISDLSITDVFNLVVNFLKKVGENNVN